MMDDRFNDEETRGFMQRNKTYGQQYSITSDQILTIREMAQGLDKRRQPSEHHRVGTPRFGQGVCRS